MKSNSPILRYLLVWAALLILLAITVTAAYFHLGRFNAVVAITIAAIKVILIAAYFMHLRSDSRLFSYLFIAGCVLAVPLIVVISLVMPALWRAMESSRALLIEDGRFAAIGRGLEADADVVIDANGATAFPGLIDSHVHPVFGAGCSGMWNASRFPWPG